MGFDFINDLDEYFCEKYANYDHICILKGYEMPKMHATEQRADGRTYTYTLPAATMRLSDQKNKKMLLEQLKEKMIDMSFSFSFVPYTFWERFKNIFKKNTFKNLLINTLAHYNIKPVQIPELVNIGENEWKGICKGLFTPSKNLIFSIALSCHMTLDDATEMMSFCGYEIDYSIVKDTVLAYLISRKVYNTEMVKAALNEYKIENMFLKGI